MYASRNPSFPSSLRAETAPTILFNDSDVNLQHLLTACPHVEALYHEIFCFTSSAASVCNVTPPTTMASSNCLLREGTKLLSPFRNLHFDEKIYGEEAQEFEFERFMGVRNAELAKKKNNRPFRGGTTYCPGIFGAKRKVFMFVVVVLTRFNIATVNTAAGNTEKLKTDLVKMEKQAFPRLDHLKLSSKVMDPVAGDDLVLHVTPRYQYKWP